MKNILFSSAAALSLMFLSTGCYGEKAEGVKSAKCGASGKCNTGKCGSGK